jgi:hypothetical protein
MADEAAFGYHPSLARQARALRERPKASEDFADAAPESGAEAMLRKQEALARALSLRGSVMAPGTPQTEADRRASWYSAAGYTPEDVRGGMRGLLSSPTQISKAMDWASLAPLITAWHGSPHKFEKFDASKIGTGEGAQAYGHGLYFAENPAVAADYARKLTADRNWRAADLVGVDPVTEMYTAVGKGGVKKSFHSQSEALDWARQGQENLYKVDIPDEQVAKMLDWDKPLSQQPEVYEAWLRAAQSHLGRTPQINPHAMTGAQAYNFITGGASGMHGYGEIAAKGSAALRKAGIPGIRYLDQGSRAGGKGTSNFVVFDPDMAKILARE